VAADAAARVFGPAAEPVVTAVSLISLVTVLNAMVMTFPRVLFGVSRAFNIPVFSRVAANGTPRAALFATVGLAALLASIGVYDLLLAFSVSLLAAMGMMANAAVIVMRVREPGLERPWKMPLYPFPAILALVINGVLWLAFVSEDPWTALQAFVALSALTALAWLVMRRTQARAVKEST
jgi:APA family basic amino acid/polyamine antiporter